MTSVGPRGYGDYQRTVNYDGPQLFGLLEGLLFTGRITSAVLEVSRYAYLCLLFGPVTLTLKVQLTWTMDAAGTETVGFREFIYDLNINEPLQARIPNMGPFVKIVIFPTPETGKWEGLLRVFPSNRNSPVEAIPRKAVQIIHNKLVKVAETVSAFPQSLTWGPGIIFYEGGGKPATVILEAETGNNVFTPVAVINVAEGVTRASAAVVLPSTSWRITVVNGATEQTVKVSIVPSLTGSD